MAEIINLRQARKARARADRERQAEVNRAKFGRSKAERRAELQEALRAQGLVEGSKRDVGDDGAE